MLLYLREKQLHRVPCTALLGQLPAVLALDAGAALRAADMAQGMATGLSLCADPAGRAQMADAAQRFSAQHRGAAQRMALAIVGIVPRPLSAPAVPMTTIK